MSAEMQLHIVASLLRRGRGLDQLSTGLTLLALAFGLSQLIVEHFTPLNQLLITVLVVLGLMEKYWALRVAFDADLFNVLACQPERLDERTVTLDHSLNTLGLQPADRSGRPWTERSRGALKLLMRQTIFLALQVLLTLSAILIVPWLSFAK